MGKIYTSVDQLIGGTPLLELTHLERELGLSARILGKLESFNPGGSAKDRIAKSMLDDGGGPGILKSGSVIIEPTSGNTGIGLALVAAARGYRAIIVMPDTMSQERRQLLLAYGAEVVLTEGRLGMAGPSPGRRSWPGRSLAASSPANLKTQPIPPPTAPPPARRSGRTPTGRWTSSWPG